MHQAHKVMLVSYLHYLALLIPYPSLSAAAAYVTIQVHKCCLTHLLAAGCTQEPLVIGLKAVRAHLPQELEDAITAYVDEEFGDAKIFMPAT